MDMRNKALELWEHLAITGESSKINAYRILGFEPDENECPLCELALANSEEDSLNCKNCLLYNKWHGETRTDYQVCMDSETYFGYWYQAESKLSRQVYARAVYNNLVKEWKPDSDEHER